MERKIENYKLSENESKEEAQRSFDELDDRGVGDDWSIEESYVNGFSNGAEFGYNKANEWHEIERNYCRTV